MQIATWTKKKSSPEFGIAKPTSEVTHPFSSLGQTATLASPAHRKLSSALLSKHDSNNIEIKIDVPASEPGVSYGLEIAMFFPKTFRTEVHTKNEIWSDFDSRVRLQAEPHKDTTELLEPGQRFFRWKEIETSINEVRRLCYVQNESTKLVQEIQKLGYLTTEWIQSFFRHQSQSITFIYVSVSPQIDQESGMNLLESHQDLMKLGDHLVELRALCEQLRSRDQMLAVSLAEFIHFNLVKNLSACRKVFEEHRKNGLGSIRHLNSVHNGSNAEVLVSEAFDKLQTDEARFLYSTSLLTPPATEHEHEEYIIRIGNLKKFFQSPSFVSVTKREGLKKFSEPIATASALLAGSIGAAFQQVSESGVAKVGTGSFSLIALAILLYAFRDRFKDWGKAFLAKKLFSKIPEFEEQLSCQGVQLGNAKKWLNITTAAKLTHHTDLIHAKDSQIVNRRNMSEECILFREEIIPISKGKKNTFKNLNKILKSNEADHSSTSTSLESQPRIHLLHILRINLRRYQRFMDDTEKTVMVLNEKGILQAKTVQKLYPFIFSVHQSQVSGEKTLASTPHIFRVLMNRNGIERVEPVATGRPDGDLG